MNTSNPINFDAGETVTIDLQRDKVIFTHWSPTDKSGASSELFKQVLTEAEAVAALLADTNEIMTAFLGEMMRGQS